MYREVDRDVKAVDLTREFEKRQQQPAGSLFQTFLN